VEATTPIIVATDVTDDPNDTQQAHPRLTQALVNTGQVPRTASLDAGYFSEANVTAITAVGCDPLIPPDRQLPGRAVPAAPRGRPPTGLSVAERMRRTLRPKWGRTLYAKRKTIMEPVLGPIKQGRGFRQFLLRGMRKVRGEWALICTTHNVLKLGTALRHRRRRPGDGLRTLGGQQEDNAESPERGTSDRGPHLAPHQPFDQQRESWLRSLNAGQVPRADCEGVGQIFWSIRTPGPYYAILQ
jgi:hypothetical protein